MRSRLTRILVRHTAQREASVRDSDAALKLGRWIWSDSISLEPAAALQRPAVTPRTLSQQWKVKGSWQADSRAFGE